MARTLTADERLRYPWASRITDFVPVGAVRKTGVLLAVLGLAVLAIGVGGIYVTAPNIHAGVSISGSLAGRIVLVASGVLMGVGAVVGLVTLVTAIVRTAKTPIVWSVLAMVPGVAAFLVVLLRVF